MNQNKPTLEEYGLDKESYQKYTQQYIRLNAEKSKISHPDDEGWMNWFMNMIGVVSGGVLFFSVLSFKETFTEKMCH